jgi:nitroimidazol reductase NimA-like FMN-containing flavoprotein (pyridoxamine 5'-phosphate oxidase superfamily)
MTPLSPTDRSTVRRVPARARTDRADLYAVLDAGLICHLAVVVDGAPRVLPTCYGRIGGTLYLHGSTGAASLREGGAGAAVCVAVTLLDGVVYARSVFHHSMNYRSAVVHGHAAPVTDAAEKLRGLRAVVDQAAPGSWDRARLPTPKELAATAVLALDLAESSVKVRTGPPVDEDSDVAAGTVWAGTLPLRTSWGDPEPCPLLPPGLAAPRHVATRGGGMTDRAGPELPAATRGQHTAVANRPADTGPGLSAATRG